MITLHLLQLLANNGLGTIDTDLFFQKEALDEVGVYITNIGDPSPRGQRTVQSYELLSRGEDDLDGGVKLDEIRDFLIASYSSVCELPVVPDLSAKVYKNVTITRPSTITSVGLDANNRMIYSIQGSIIY
jgi:hypothetical protein